MTDCKKCENAVFDEKWGEYKCKKRKIRLNFITKWQGCEHYKRKTGKKSS